MIFMDYAYLTDRGLFKRDEVDEESMKTALTVLVAYDSFSRGPVLPRSARQGCGTGRVCRSEDC